MVDLELIVNVFPHFMLEEFYLHVRITIRVYKCKGLERIFLLFQDTITIDFVRIP